MRRSIIKRAAVASLFICQILAAPQGRGSIDDTRALELPAAEDMVTRLSLASTPIPTIVSPTLTTLVTEATPNTTTLPSSKNQVLKAKTNKVASRGEGAGKAIVYNIASGDKGASSTSGLRIYRNGKLLTDIVSNGADSMTVDSALPSPVAVTVTAGDAPGSIKSCSGSYADQTKLEGWVGAGYENLSGLGPARSSTYEVDFEC